MTRGPAAVLAMACLGYAGTAVSLETIVFRTPGADEDLQRQLRNASLLLAAEEREEGVDDIQELLASARAEYIRLLSVLYAEGRFGGEISVEIDGREAAGLSPLDPPDQIDRIEVTVQPGPVYRFGEAEVAPLASGTQLPEEFAAGRTARLPVLRDSVSTAVSAWRARGHAKAEPGRQSIVARHPQTRVDAEVQIIPGPRARFGDFVIVGNEDVRTDAVRRIAGFPGREGFNPARMRESAERLRETGAFRSVAFVEADEIDPDGTLDIEVRVVEDEPRRFGFGAEYATDDGVTVTAFHIWRNLFGGAERLSLSGAVSGIGGTSQGFRGGSGDGTDFSFGAELTRPATLNASTDLILGAEIARRNEPEFSSDSIEVGFRFNRQIRDTTSVEAGIEYVYSRDEDDSGETTYSLLTFPVAGMADRRDDPLDPTSGFYFETEVTPFVGLNADSDDGARLTADARTYYGFGEEDRVVLAGRLQLGSIVGADLMGVPNSFRFFSGGGGTVRGHDFQSLGVTLDGDVTSGGASFVGLSAEARVGVRENIEAVGFVDYGYVGEESFPDGSGGDHVGAGVGLRYLTAIGPIRLDVAAPVTGESDSSFQLYVGIGQAF